MLKADATGICSQKIVSSSGFKFLSERYYGKYVNENGEPILEVEAPHLKLVLFYKDLNAN